MKAVRAKTGSRENSFSPKTVTEVLHFWLALQISDSTETSTPPCIPSLLACPANSWPVSPNCVSQFLTVNLSGYMENGFCFCRERTLTDSGRAGMSSLTPAVGVPREAQLQLGGQHRAPRGPLFCCPPPTSSRQERRHPWGWLRGQGQEENRDQEQVIRLLQDAFFWVLGWP